MKKFTLRLLLGFFTLLTFSPESADAQSATNIHELIIQIPTDITREFTQLKTEILALGNIQFVSYCKEKRCMMLKIDRLVHTNDAAITTLLKNKNLPFDIKMDATIAQVMGQCSDNIVISSPDAK